ncbi:hypothetical protein Q5O89_25755 [Peribacillus frigoritolerans]|nr:hypothetical protein [Peribacillus frigoritolerans]
MKRSFMLMPVVQFSVHGVSNVYSAHMSLSMVPGSFLARLYGDALHSVQLWKGIPSLNLLTIVTVLDVMVRKMAPKADANVVA